MRILSPTPQTGSPGFMFGGLIAQNLRAPRANRVFRTDKKCIRPENTVMVKSKFDLGLSLYKIADWVRMCFSSAPNRRSARTASRPRNNEAVQLARF